MKSSPGLDNCDSLQAEELPVSGAALLELMQPVLARGLPFRFRARGGSMAPFICDGDIIDIAPLGGRAPSLGEVVAFIQPETGRLILHRLIAKKADAYLLQGDNLPRHPDGLIPASALLGRVTQVEHAGRRLYLGLGPERTLIAFFSRRALLRPILRLSAPFLRLLAPHR